MEKDDDKFYAFRSQWLDYIAVRRDFTHGDFRVAYFIASKINSKEKRMWWSVKGIAEGLSVSAATVVAATKKLDKHRLIMISKKRFCGNNYSMKMPITAAEDAFDLAPMTKKKTGGRKRRVSRTETKWISETET